MKNGKLKKDAEKHLISAAKKDIKEFGELYSLYFDKIFLYIKSKVNGDRATADDLTSATFEKALRNIKSFQWQGISFSAWIYKIANNTIIDYYRSQNVRKGDAAIHENIKDESSSSIEQDLIQYDSASRIKSVLDELNERERGILTLKFYEGYTNKSIAKKLNISETNVGTIVYRAIKKIREIILSRNDINV